MSYEEYANRHGLTLGDQADFMMTLRDYTEVLWVNGIITDTEYYNALNKLDKKVIEIAKPITATQQV